MSISSGRRSSHRTTPPPATSSACGASRSPRFALRADLVIVRCPQRRRSRRSRSARGHRAHAISPHCLPPPCCVALPRLRVATTLPTATALRCATATYRHRATHHHRVAYRHRPASPYVSPPSRPPPPTPTRARSSPPRWVPRHSSRGSRRRRPPPSLPARPPPLSTTPSGTSKPPSGWTRASTPRIGCCSLWRAPRWAAWRRRALGGSAASPRPPGRPRTSRRSRRPPPSSPEPVAASKPKTSRLLVLRSWALYLALEPPGDATRPEAPGHALPAAPTTKTEYASMRTRACAFRFRAHSRVCVQCASAGGACQWSTSRGTARDPQGIRRFNPQPWQDTYKQTSDRRGAVRMVCARQPSGLYHVRIPHHPDRRRES